MLWGWVLSGLTRTFVTSAACCMAGRLKFNKNSITRHAGDLRLHNSAGPDVFSAVLGVRGISTRQLFFAFRPFWCVCGSFERMVRFSRHFSTKTLRGHHDQHIYASQCLLRKLFSSAQHEQKGQLHAKYRCIPPSRNPQGRN